ncbi:hypothetical protein ACJX0J_028902, partial [Zea mays]
FLFWPSKYKIFLFDTGLNLVLYKLTFTGRNFFFLKKSLLDLHMFMVEFFPMDTRQEHVNYKHITIIYKTWQIMHGQNWYYLWLCLGLVISIIREGPFCEASAMHITPTRKDDGPLIFKHFFWSFKLYISTEDIILGKKCLGLILLVLTRGNEWRGNEEKKEEKMKEKENLGHSAVSAEIFVPLINVLIMQDVFMFGIKETREQVETNKLSVEQHLWH